MEVVKAELPSVKSEDINLSVKNDLLTIRGEKKKEVETEKQDYYSTEYGKFQRIIQLPADVNSDETIATYKNGILKVELPKLQKKEHKQIVINSG